MTHYDIIICNDVARDVHCDIMGHDVVMGAYDDTIPSTHEIPLHKNNSPHTPDKDTLLTASCYSMCNISLAILKYYDSIYSFLKSQPFTHYCWTSVATGE